MLLPFLVHRWFWIQQVIARLCQRKIGKERTGRVDVVARLVVWENMVGLALFAVESAEDLQVVLPGLVGHRVVVDQQRSKRFE